MSCRSSSSVALSLRTGTRLSPLCVATVLWSSRAIGAVHMVIDVAIMLLPVHFVSKLQMPTSAKLGICLVFLIGFSYVPIHLFLEDGRAYSLGHPELERTVFSNLTHDTRSICAVSIARMAILSKLNFDDISYDMLDSVFWTVIEPALVIVNACLQTSDRCCKTRGLRSGRKPRP